MPKALPGYSGGEMPGTSKADGGTEEKEDEKWRHVEKDVVNAVLRA